MILYRDDFTSGSSDVQLAIHQRVYGSSSMERAQRSASLQRHADLLLARMRDYSEYEKSILDRIEYLRATGVPSALAATNAEMSYEGLDSLRAAANATMVVDDRIRGNPAGNTEPDLARTTYESRVRSDLWFLEKELLRVSHKVKLMRYQAQALMSEQQMSLAMNAQGTNQNG